MITMQQINVLKQEMNEARKRLEEAVAARNEQLRTEPLTPEDMVTINFA